MDLLVIMPFESEGLRHALEMISRVDPRFAVDVIVRHPHDACDSTRRVTR